jgi:hypothetical protein
LADWLKNKEAALMVKQTLESTEKFENGESARNLAKVYKIWIQTICDTRTTK